MRHRARTALCLLALWSSPAASPAVAGLAQIDAALGDAADQIADPLRARRLVLAVPDLGTLDARNTVLGRYVAEELVTALFARGVAVVERSLLDRALTELKLGTSDLMNPQAAKRFGRFVGAQAIVTGTLTDLGRTIKLNARVVDVETGQVVGAAAAEFMKDEAASEMLDREVPNRWPAQG